MYIAENYRLMKVRTVNATQTTAATTSTATIAIDGPSSFTTTGAAAKFMWGTLALGSVNDCGRGAEGAGCAAGGTGAFWGVFSSIRFGV